MAVAASLVMKFLDSDVKAFPYRTGKEHLLCVTGYFQLEILVRTRGVMSVPTGRIQLPHATILCPRFQKSGLWLRLGFVDASGNEVISPAYEFCYGFSSGVAVVKGKGMKS